MENRKHSYTDQQIIAANQNMKERDYWLEKLSGEFEKTIFPYDNRKPIAESKLSLDSVKFKLSGELFSRLINLSRGSYYTLHIILVAGVVLLLNKYTGKKDITIGTPVYKQDTEGEFINTILPLRHQLKANMTFKELLYLAKQTIMEAIEHQNFPIQLLIERLNLPGLDTGFPLFEIAVLLENIHKKEYLEYVHVQPTITFSFLKSENHLEGNLEYNSILFNQPSIKRIVSHTEHVLRRALVDVDVPVNDIDILSEEERKQLLEDFNNTDIQYPLEKTIHQLFEEQVEKIPDNIAVVGPGVGTNQRFMVFVTYRELNERANGLAHLLIEKGVKPDTIVGIILERSLDMIITILGVLKAGAAYLPIDVGVPTSRIISMLEDGDVSILLTHSHTIEKHSFIDLQNLQCIQWEPYVTAGRRQIKDLDSLPLPDRSMVNYEKYSKYIGVAPVKNSISIQATRGCPYNCAYCFKIWPRKHVFRSAENIFEEIHLYYKMGVKRFSIIDDIFNLDRKNSMSFFQLIVKQGMDLQIFFPAGLRADILTEDYIDLMIEAGTKGFSLALETASPRLQKLIEKHLNLEKLHENIEYICGKYPEVILDLQTMHGFPTETEEEAMMTLNFIKSIKWLHFPYLNILRIYTNTGMEKLALKSGISRQAIVRSENMSFHDLPETLPFDKGFTFKYQTEFLNDYFLLKERLLHVLPHQMNILTEGDIIQAYSTYLPIEINSFSELLDFVGIKEEELKGARCRDDDYMAIPHFNEKLSNHFPKKEPNDNAFRILLLDLSQSFTGEVDRLNELVEPPLGPMYVMSYLQQQLGSKINGKIAKSRVDFNSYGQLKKLLVQFNPYVIGIKTLTYFRDFFHKTVEMIRLWRIDVPIVAGGPYATSSYRSILQDKNIDLVVLGEGEIIFTEVIEKVMENNGRLPDDDVLKKIAGIAFIPGKTHKTKNGNHREVMLLDAFDSAPGGEGKPRKNIYIENPEPINKLTDLAYVIFTSGSTGKPKGVQIEHQGAVNTLLSRKALYQFNSHDACLQLFPYAFDGFITSFFTPIISGSPVVIPGEDEIKDITKLKELIAANKVTHFISVPALFQAIMEHLTAQEAADLKVVTLAGDMFSPHLLELVKEKNAALEIVNEYGVTEAAVMSTIYRHQEKDAKVKIGRPTANTKLYVLNRDNTLQPIGVPGELCIAGRGLARGYLNNPELTSSKFQSPQRGQPKRNFKLQITNCKRMGLDTGKQSTTPFTPMKSFCGAPGAPAVRRKNMSMEATHRAKRGRLYKTGDLAQWLPDGNIELLGRMDHQVKVRGFRIETSEIERQLLKHENIKEAVVIAREDTHQEKKYLCAYYVEKENTKPELWPSVAEFFIYDDLLYYAMTGDEDRNNSYRAAINRFVKDKIVVDIGTGRDAILARFCVEAGAKKVYAIEILEESYNKAKETVKTLNLEGKIILIHGDATKVQLPGKADVCVSEIVGAVGGSEGAAAILKNAKRFLNKDNIMIPVKSITRIAAVSLPASIREDPGFSQVPAQYVEKIFDHVGYTFDLRVCIKSFPASHIISNAGTFEIIDFSGPIHLESTQEINLEINQETNLDGFLLWLNLYLMENEVIDILEKEYCWLPVFVPVFYPGIKVSRGDGIRAVCVQTLNENGINPDYVIEGELIRKNGDNLRFRYLLPHFDKSFKHNSFYQELFIDDSIKKIKSRPKLNVRELRNFLAKELPDYMIPSFFVPLDAFPLTVTGKIDRKQLPEPKGNASRDYQYPEDEIEAKLVEVWQDVLGIKKIGINENFFEIGGDSINIIQVSSRLQKFNLKLEISDIFVNPTIKELAKCVKKLEPTSVVDQGPVEGDVPLTPIQEWFFENNFSHCHHFNQSLMIFNQQGFDEAIVKKVFDRIVEHHDALRMVFMKKQGTVVQWNRGVSANEKTFDLKVIDLTDNNDIELETEIEKQANCIQESIDLEEGPLVKLGLFKTKDGDHLLMVIHHLVVDGISWRILLEDFSIGYKQVEREDDILFQDKTCSFKYWASRLTEYVESNGVLMELDFWRELENLEIGRLPRDYEIGIDQNKNKNNRTVAMSLTKEETDILLQKVNWAYNTEINEILLTALGMAVEDTFGIDRVLVNLEGHGREDIIEHIDVSRTVGWFTSQFPVVLDMSVSTELSYRIKQVKENIRKIPNKGIGYGILRYLLPGKKEESLSIAVEPEINFNYLGKFGQLVDNAADAGAGSESIGFTLSAMKVGHSISPEMERKYLIDINGIVVDGRLQVYFAFNTYEFNTSTIKELVDKYKENLIKIIEHCSQKEEKELTPSDMEYAEIGIEELEEFESELSDID
jgi:amino acid adenylation domain-containing protein/non-ribosomal peptide synthase protein (TIGR01720 family)